MFRGSPRALIIGGVLMILIDAAGVSRGRLPLQGTFSTVVDQAQHPAIFWAYATGLGLIGTAALLSGLWRRK